MNDNYNLDFYNLALIKESEKLINLCSRYKKIITIEEHSIVNGLFSFISSLLSKNKILKEIDYIALPNEHISLVGDQKLFKGKSYLNSDALYSKINE